MSGGPAGPTDGLGPEGNGWDDAASPAAALGDDASTPTDPPEDRPFWHLAELVHWEAAVRRGRYERSTLGASLQQVGFIHAAYPEQLAAVVRAHFARCADPLVVLEIDPARLREHGTDVRLEAADPSDPSGDRYPHIVGPLPLEAVTRTRPAVVARGWLDLGPWESVGGVSREAGSD